MCSRPPGTGIRYSQPQPIQSVPRPAEIDSTRRDTHTPSFPATFSYDATSKERIRGGLIFATPHHPVLSALATRLRELCLSPCCLVFLELEVHHHSHYALFHHLGLRVGCGFPNKASFPWQSTYGSRREYSYRNAIRERNPYE